MWNRVIFLVALTIAVALVPRVYLTVEAVIGLFPIEEGDIVTVDLDAVLWIWRRKGTLALNILTLILLTELITIYVATLRFWYGGIPEIRLY
jgi:hypothetical protein